MNASQQPFLQKKVSEAMIHESFSYAKEIPYIVTIL